MTIKTNGQFSPARQPNERLRRARLRMPMSRQQLAEAVNAQVFHTTGIRTAMDAHYVARLEQGKRRWPNAAYRAALRHVLGVANDAETGFHFRSTAVEAFAVANEHRMTQAVIRLPSDAERRELHLPVGTPVLQIRNAGMMTGIVLALPTIGYSNGSDQPTDRHT
jgi:transcriptional regulator with XRE-family HTH domain